MRMILLVQSPLQAHYLVFIMLCYINEYMYTFFMFAYLQRAISHTSIDTIDLSEVGGNIDNNTPRPLNNIRMRTEGTSSIQGTVRGGKGGAGVIHMCPSCNYCAKWPTELQKHIVVHANSRPFVCVICGNCYKWSWDLGRHFSAVHASLPNPYKFNRNISKLFKKRSVQ